jgi:hypothetical protein
MSQYIPKLSDADFIDVHYHTGPDAYIRRHSACTAGLHYKSAKGWVVLKNHLGCTASQAWEARNQGFPVSGSIVLNEIAGGINWRSVEKSLCQQGDFDGRFIVHFPTVTGRYHQSRLSRESSHPILNGTQKIAPLTVSDGAGKLTAATLDIFRMARDYPIVISTGHADRDETLLLVDAAVQYDAPRLMLNQPANPLTGLHANDLYQISKAEMVYFEQTALTYLLGYQSKEDFQEVLLSVPRVIYSSDLGQPSQPDILEWLDTSRQWFKNFDLPMDRIDELTRRNPLAMLSR